MGQNQSDRQASVRATTGTALTYEGDWHALFDSAGIASGDFNGRLLAWINGKLFASYSELNGAMQAYAASKGAPSWNELGAFTIGPSSWAYVTGDRTAAITVTQTSGLLAGTLSGLVNGVTNDTGVSYNAVALAGKQIVFDFKGVSKYINEARVYTALGNGLTLGTFKWQGSNDGSAWADIGTSFALASTPSPIVMTSMSANTAAYKFYSLTGVSGTGNISPWICEFQFKEGA